MEKDGWIPCVAVIDTGLDYSSNYSKDVIGGVAFFIENNNIYMSDDYMDEIGHGTQVCSIIKRYCPNAMLYMIKIYGVEISTSSSLLVLALEHLLEKKIDIINISLAVNSESNVSEICRIIDRLSEQGKIIISSVKNRSEQSFPANYHRCYGVIGKNGIKEGDFLFEESRTIQIYSNGTPEYVEGLHGKKEWFYGNSKATACMTGCIAALLQEEYNKKQIKKSEIDNLLKIYQKKRKSNMNIIVKLIDVCRNYGKGENIVKALNKVNLEISRGEFVAIVGASGSGKSTLLNVMGGLDNPTDGIVIIDGTELGKLKTEELTVFRRDCVGFVFQNYNLINILTVYENIVLPIQIGGKQEDIEFVKKIIEFLGLSGLEDRLPNQLSGGQQQRVAIARALASKPAIILADEPTGNLDSSASDEVISCLKKSAAEFGQTVVIITHNNEIANLCDRILIMKDGSLAEKRE